MKLTSPAFENGQPIPSRYAYRHDNASPPLDISDVPPGAQSLALIVTDPDAPGGTFTHWLIWNIDSSTTSIHENVAPQGSILGTNDFGNQRWDGPAPPSGTHHYHFTVYALDAMLDTPQYSDYSTLRDAMRGHVISSAELVGTYSTL